MLTATVAGGALAAAVLAVEAGQDSAVTVALIGTVGGLAVAVTTGVFALLKDRKPEPSPVKYVEEPTTFALPAALVDFYNEQVAEAVERAVKAEQERDALKVWALARGWTP